MSQPVIIQRIAALVAYGGSGTSVLLIVIWLFAYCGGLGWDRRVVFNWHPLLMAMAWLIFTTQGTNMQQRWPT